MNHYLSTIFCITLTSCTSIYHKDDKYIELSDKITTQYIKNVCKGRKFSFVGKGGRVTDEVQEISLILETFATVDISSARELIIDKEEEFLELLNGMQEIRPYLLHYPSRADSLGLRIGFKNSRGSFVSPPDIAMVSVFNNIISYKTFEITNRSFTTVYSEPYEEGYKIVYGREKE